MVMFDKRMPRKPTIEEKQKLIDWLIEDQGVEFDNAENWIENAYISVFPNYQTGSPGYVGKIIFLVFDGSPNFFSVFIEVENKLVKIEEER